MNYNDIFIISYPLKDEEKNEEQIKKMYKKSALSCSFSIEALAMLIEEENNMRMDYLLAEFNDPEDAGKILEDVDCLNLFASMEEYLCDLFDRDKTFYLLNGGCHNNAQNSFLTSFPQDMSNYTPELKSMAEGSKILMIGGAV